MAELTTSIKSTGKKSLHKIIRVDLTPMVDLGFLLITFFILTTTLRQQQVMKLILPKDSTIQTFLSESTTLTFILESNDSIGYYDGLAKKINYANFSAMRSIIQQKQFSLITNRIDKNKLTILIKPTTKCTYKNFIDALDEVTINDCKHYFVAEPEKNEIL
ncbi:MAG: biopolymer transporter ExbD [Ginsengibacter sp.]